MKMEDEEIFSGLLILDHLVRATHVPLGPCVDTSRRVSAAVVLRQLRSTVNDTALPL